jgi:hypothetical protein
MEDRYRTCVYMFNDSEAERTVGEVMEETCTVRPRILFLARP